MVLLFLVEGSGKREGCGEGVCAMPDSEKDTLRTVRK